MKKIVLLSLNLITLLIAPASFAGGSSSAGLPGPRQQSDINSEILNHSVVQGVEKLLNDKYSNQCVLPSTPQDIHWMCLGALPPVTQPEIFPSSCGFELIVTCPGENVYIFGSKTSYQLVVPQGQSNPVAPTGEYVTINSVHFQ